LTDSPVILQGWVAVRKHMHEQGIRVTTTTLQNWRRERGLPVRRNTAFREVYAEAEELDQWILRELIGKD